MSQLLLLLMVATFIFNGGDVFNRINAVMNTLTASTESTGRFMNFGNLFGTKQHILNEPDDGTMINQEYDFVIVGAGSAGSALAYRLSEVSNWNILVLEAGGEPNILNEVPMLASTLQFTDQNWGYLIERQSNMGLGLRNQRMHWPSGKGLGGSSLINFMLYIRGNKADYDRWAADGNPGWNYDNVLPYFRKLESCTVKDADSGYRNNSGPVFVEDLCFKTKLADAFVQSSVEAGYPLVDYNGKEQLGVSYVQTTTRKGLRWNAYKAYLSKLADRPNITVLPRSHVTKVLIDGDKKAYGVEFVYEGLYRKVRANKEVILSAGAFHSPQLLMLSGIGPKEHLDELSIPVVKDLPVGKKLYDHLTFLGLLFTVDGEDMSFQFRYMFNPVNYYHLFTGQTSPLCNTGGVEALAYLKTNVSKDLSPVPDVELIFTGAALSVDRGIFYNRMFAITDEIYQAVFRPVEHKQVWQVCPMLLHPKSYGRLELRSKDPFDPPKLYGNYFTDPNGEDIKTFLAAIRETQRIAKSPAFQKIGTKQVTTPIPGCEHIKFDTDKYWICALRHLSATLYHQISTAKMGPASDPEAVVDNNLKVYGIQGLRVVDCSVIPRTLSAHTNIPAMMIGEKASDIIKNDYK